MSPYPVEVMAATLHHMLEEILENLLCGSAAGFSR